MHFNVSNLTEVLLTTSAVTETPNSPQTSTSLFGRGSSPSRLASTTEPPYSFTRRVPIPSYTHSVRLVITSMQPAASELPHVSNIESRDGNEENSVPVAIVCCCWNCDGGRNDSTTDSPAVCISVKEEENEIEREVLTTCKSMQFSIVASPVAIVGAVVGTAMVVVMIALLILLLFVFLSIVDEWRQSLRFTYQGRVRRYCSERALAFSVDGSF